MEFQVSSFMGMKPYGVAIEETPELTTLIEEAKQHVNLPFQEKLEKVKSIAVGAMQNAYENWQSGKCDAETTAKCQKIVMSENSLSEALKQKAGCCRYQATLFFILGEAARLGDKHYLQSAPIMGNVNTCFNDVIYEGKVHHVSVFVASLNDQRYNYSRNPQLFESVNKAVRGEIFLAYTVKGEEVQKFAREGMHFDTN